MFVLDKGTSCAQQATRRDAKLRTTYKNVTASTATHFSRSGGYTTPGAGRFSRQFEPSARPPVRFVQDKQSRYIAIRLREIHDILHVLYDCPTTLKGELTLKAIEFVQYGLPAHWASAYFAPSRLPLAERNFLTNQLFPWAIRTASKAPNLLSFDYESLFHTPIDQLRDDWKIERIPCSSA